MNKKWIGLFMFVILIFAISGFYSCSRKAEKDSGENIQKVPDKEMQQTQSMPEMGNVQTSDSSEAPKAFISPERQQTIGVRSVPAERKEISREIRTLGRVTYDETRVTHIHTKVNGWVQDVFVNFVGQSVKRGQPLFTLYSPDLLSTQQEYLLALKTQKELGSSSYSWVAKGSNELVESARQRLKLWDVTDSEIRKVETTGEPIKALTIYSPVNGVVMERSAYHHGMYITPEMELYTIVDLSKVWLLADVYEKDLPFVQTGQHAEIEYPYAAKKSITGKVSFFYPTLNAQTRTGQVRVELPNPNNQLKPDQYLNVRIAVEKVEELVVPSDAVLNTGEQQYVFVDLGNGYFEPREVKVALQTSDETAIEDGLNEGERVVTSANFLIDSESKLKGVIAEMGKPKKRAAATTMSQNVLIELLEPKTGKSGDNKFVVSVKDKSGNPITGAEVQVVVSMPAMGSMPPMSNNGMLLDKGNGIYSGTVQIPMAWTWDTVITVRKNGQLLGTKQTSVTVR